MEQIELDDLKGLLERAYEDGNAGYMGMKGESVSRIVDEFVASRPAPPQPSFTVTTSSFGQQNVVSPYYYYSTMTVPPPEIVRRDEVV